MVQTSLFLVQIQAFLVQIWYSNVSCDLEIMDTVTKILKLKPYPTKMYTCEFDQNPPIGSDNRLQ